MNKKMVAQETYLAIDMKPSQEVWEQLGFKFTNIPGDNVLCRAELPEGWSIRESQHKMLNTINDENGMIRGKFIYVNEPYNRDAHMTLVNRYGARVELNSVQKKETIYFGNSMEKLFVAGYLNLPSSVEGWKDFEIKEKYLLKQAEQFGDENYPEWRDISAYWEKGFSYKTKVR